MVGDAQAFDLEVPVLYNTCFDDCIFEQWMKGRNKQRCRTSRCTVSPFQGLDLWACNPGRRYAANAVVALPWAGMWLPLSGRKLMCSKQ